MTALGYDPNLKRVVRRESWEGLKTGTYPLAREAFLSGDREKGIELSDFFVEEAEIIFGIYTQWLPDIRRCLHDKGLSETELGEEEATVADLVFARYPEVERDRTLAWQAVQEAAATLHAVASKEGSVAALDLLWTRWRELHDSQVDYVAGLLDIVIRHFGEPAIGELYENWVIGDWFNKRYAKFDVSKYPWKAAFKDLVYLSFESMHAHLSGPNRDGSVGFEEFEDRVTLSFAPCGSGGRTVGGDAISSRTPLMEPPFNYGTLGGQHDFAWRTPGICAYCAHCCVILEKLPIEHFGYPVRVVDPPTYPSREPALCRWTIYRDPRNVPDSVYQRLGKTKPSPDVPLGSAGVANKRES